MATVKGVNKTKIDTPTPANRLNPGQTDGRVKTFQDTYECSTTAAGTIIEMGPDLTVGAIVLEVVLTCDALGGSVTLAVGDSGDADRYITATAMNTANKVTRINAIDGRNYAITSTTRQITITIAGASATNTIKLTVYYTND